MGWPVAEKQHCTLSEADKMSRNAEAKRLSFSPKKRHILELPE
jgi:hypothetical protein